MQTLQSSVNQKIFSPTFLHLSYFCETLLDYQDPCPVKETLREKIHTRYDNIPKYIRFFIFFIYFLSRLKQEGSSADEPSNIALSDYSSLSSADVSSSSDDDLPGRNLLSNITGKSS